MTELTIAFFSGLAVGLGLHICAPLARAALARISGRQRRERSEIQRDGGTGEER